MTPDEWIPILSYLKDYGIEKINIAGGEPMLYPYLDELCLLIKKMGFMLSIVSNGSLITDEWLKKMEGIIDWIGLSVDSPDEDDEIVIGRHRSGINHLENIRKVAVCAHRHNINVKLNITVVRRSCHKDFHQLIEDVKPRRVKCFRALTLKGANDDIPDTWSITDNQFQEFINRHKDVDNIVFEDNDDMVASYIMFDPIGRWVVDSGYCKRFNDFEVVKKQGFESQVSLIRYGNRNAVYWGGGLK